MAQIKNYILTGVFAIAACGCSSTRKTTQHVNFRLETSMQHFDSNSPSDAYTDSIITIYRNNINDMMNRRIGYADYNMDSHRPESPLSNFVADALLIGARQVFNNPGDPRPDACIINTGGIRTAINAGNITVRNIFEISPFENSVVVLAISGHKLNEIFKHIASRNGEPVSSEIRLVIKDRQVANVTINGEPVNPDKTYYIVTNSYLAEGGDGFSYMENNQRFDTGIMMREMLIKHIEELTSNGQHINAETDNRITIEK